MIWKCSQQPPPSLCESLCHHAPCASQKDSYCVLPVPRIDPPVIFPGKNAHPSYPHNAGAAELSEGGGILLPGRPPHLTLDLMKQRWSLLSGCVSHWESNCRREKGVWFVFVWWFAEARVHMAWDHVEFKTHQQPGPQLLSITRYPGFKFLLHRCIRMLFLV